MSIEEDVKRCKKLIKIEHANWIGISNQSAISNVLAELEQDKKRIQELEGQLQKYYNGELYTAKQLKNIEKNQKKYFINKQVVKNKIEEIFTVLYEKHENDYQDIQDIIAEIHRKVRLELLEGGK